MQHAAAKTSPAVQSHMLDKTRLCRFYAKGQCTRGKACTFAHGEDQLVAQPDLYRTGICFDYFKTGVCRVGVTCKFAHSYEELRPVVELPMCMVPIPNAAPPAAMPGAGAHAKQMRRQIKAVEKQAVKLQARLMALQKMSCATVAPTFVPAVPFALAQGAWEGYMSSGAMSTEDEALWEQYQASWGMCNEDEAAWGGYTSPGGASTEDEASVHHRRSTAEGDVLVEEVGSHHTETSDEWEAESLPSGHCGPEPLVLPEVVDPAAMSIMIKNTFIEVEPAVTVAYRRRSASAPPTRR